MLLVPWPTVADVAAAADMPWPLDPVLEEQLGSALAAAIVWVRRNVPALRDAGDDARVDATVALAVRKIAARNYATRNHAAAPPGLPWPGASSSDQRDINALLGVGRAAPMRVRAAP